MNTSQDFLTKIRSLTTPEEQRACRGIYADWLDDQDKPLDAARQRVLADPTSDDRREQFADALERDGQEKWATFVRLQVKIAKGFGCSNPHYETIYDEFHGNSPVDKIFRGNCGVCSACVEAEVEQFRANARLFGYSILVKGEEFHYPIGWIEWRFPAPAGYCMNSGTLPFVPNMGVLFHRGLISEVHCPWDGKYGWKDNGDAITDAHPVGKVTLSTMPELRRESENWPGNRQIYRLVGGRGRFFLGWQEWDKMCWQRALPRFEQDLRLRLLKQEWPGIDFVLPSEQNDAEEEAGDF